ncbi:hypothetical protein ACHHYP_00333 [Achlya hypogyna]|uniref:WRKY19-like zinc finger domain-containing protein n=1 Tax=Achlya hypogyna TaxID=1202772 RepID=A0A1V9ZUM3_ACHHY|nr:hypothetical protein ACHHYP_00333 [Achlya hypogyna]
MKMDLCYILTDTAPTAPKSFASGNASPTSPEGYSSCQQRFVPTLPPLFSLHREHLTPAPAPAENHILWYRSVMARTNPLEAAVKRAPPVQTAPRGGACIIQGCRNKAVSRGKCITHGGGCRCKFEGCVNGAKMRGLCHLHGGKRQCQQEGCVKDAKLKGLCWAHGGRRPKPTQPIARK